VSRKVFIRPAANRDLDDQARYVAADSGIEIALRFLEAADDTFQLLLSHPLIGRVAPVRNRFLAGTRMFPIKHFSDSIVFYRPVRKGIEIVRIVHGSRDLEKLPELW
jgi:toxin ParE1/3/4